MSVWEELTDAEYNNVWDEFAVRFGFPSREPGEGRGIIEPTPSVTYDISTVYSPEESDWADSALVKDFHSKALAAFRRAVAPGSRMYALDWQHTSYWFAPHAHQKPENYRHWHIAILPESDYYIYLAEDMSFGTFGHPWSETICVFGQKLLDAFEADPPALFTHIVRINGADTKPDG